MNKQELLSTYTAEQLASMVINLQSASEVKNDEIHKLKWKISSLEEESGRLQAKVDTYNEYLLPRCTKEARELIDGNHFIGVMIVSCGEWNNRGKAEGEKVLLPKEYENCIREILNIDTSEIKDDCHRFGIESLQRYLKTDSPKKPDEIEHLKSEANKYRKAFEYAKKERDCQIAEYQKKIEELKKENDELKTENAELHCETQAMSMFPDEFPTEPIKIADMLIDNATAVYENYVEDFAKAYSGQLVIGNPCEDVRRQTLSYLRQIAEHLLVYCGHSEGDGNEAE